MRSRFLQSLRHYAGAVRRAYTSFVFGGVLSIAGSGGVFLSDQRLFVVVSAAGIVVGVITAPFQAPSATSRRDLVALNGELRNKGAIALSD
jgi:hypothetical protein